MVRLLPAFLYATAAFAADVSGIWIGHYTTRIGEVEVALHLKQEGTKISGKLYGDYGSSPITTGMISGDNIMFVVLSQEQAGNQINATHFRFTGSFKNGELELFRDREAATNAGNSGASGQNKGNTRQIIKLKRLI